MASTTRQALLQALSAAEGAYISGQQLAQQLGVSRAAVHKAAAALTAQGYALEAASRRGYRLLGGDPFCTEAVGSYPAPVQVYDTLESTNRTAKLLALEGAAHGTLVLAGGQTAGRGRLGRSFTSPAGKGVYCSVVLRPPLPAANAQTATIGAAVAVCRAVQMLCGLELAIKWVNDLYYKGKKVCGILTERVESPKNRTVGHGETLPAVIIGMGINTTLGEDELPVPTATSSPECGLRGWPLNTRRRPKRDDSGPLAGRSRLVSGMASPKRRLTASVVSFSRAMRARSSADGSTLR
jgi:BirA family biotin operon repressor/biotin-[acetyl-CoA-carboxylase] ligase